jgi:hypothetical protein
VTLVSVSQPLDAFESQLPYPALQVSPQRPPLQLAVAFCRGQMVVHELQWSGSVARLVSQPFPTFPSQFP